MDFSGVKFLLSFGYRSLLVETSLTRKRSSNKLTSYSQDSVSLQLSDIATFQRSFQFDGCATHLCVCSVGRAECRTSVVRSRSRWRFVHCEPVIVAHRTRDKHNTRDTASLQRRARCSAVYRWAVLSLDGRVQSGLVPESRSAEL